MNNKKILLGIFLIFIVLISTNVVFAEDVSDDTDSQDNNIAISPDNDIQSSSEQTVPVGSNSTTIQNIINSMLLFYVRAVFLPFCFPLLYFLFT